MQGENTPTDATEKQHVSEPSAVKSAAEITHASFVAAVAALMSLILTDAEKAEAVRQLLAANNAPEDHA